MARHYDRLIRFYDSWFDDFADQDKELTPAECWTIVLAIRDCQRLCTTEPLRNLPLNLRRALSMSTLIEQVDRIIEKGESMRKRGQIGGIKANQPSEHLPVLQLEQAPTAAPPQDGAERNYDGLLSALSELSLTDQERDYVIVWSNYGQIGHPVWKILHSLSGKNDKNAYFRACVQKLTTQNN